MNENREQRRNRQKRPIRAINSKLRIFCLICLISILSGVFAVCSSAVSVDYDTPNSDPLYDILSATVPYNNLVVNTKYDILSDQTSYNYNYPSSSYIHGLSSTESESKLIEVEGDVVINPDGTITTIYGEGQEYIESISRLRKFFYLRRVKGVTEDSSDYINFAASQLNKYNTTLWLSKDGKTYRQINTVFIDLYKGMEISDGAYLIDENYGAGSYECTITWKDGKLPHLKFDNMPENSEKGHNMEYPYLWMKSDQFRTIQEYFDKLKEDGILTERVYNSLDTIFNKSTYNLRESRTYNTPAQRIMWQRLDYSILSTMKYRTTFNRQTQSMYPLNTDSNLSLTLKTNMYQLNYSDSTKMPSIQIITSDDVTTTVKTTIYYTFVETFTPDDYESPVQDPTTDYYKYEVKTKDKIIPLLPNLQNVIPASHFNTTKNILLIDYIETKISIGYWTSDAIFIDWLIPYTTNNQNWNIDNWISQQTGNEYLTFDPKEPARVTIDDSFLGWLANTTSQFFDIQIFGSISLGSIIWFCVGIGTLFAVLKIFAGG